MADIRFPSHPVELFLVFTMLLLFCV